MRTTQRIVSLLLVGLMAMGAVFAEGASETAEETKEVKLTYVNWEEGVAWTHFLATVLEDEMGYDVELTVADVAIGYQAVAEGDQDFFMEAWLPNLHTRYVEGTDLVQVSEIYSDAVVGLIVPAYMAEDGVTSLSDLADPEVVEKLGGVITGIDAGAGMMIETEEKLIPAYGLSEAGIELVPSSGPAMMAALDAAIANEEYIVGMGWQPHSMFGRYDLVILEQDGEQIWDLDNIYIMGRPDVDEDLPEVVEFFDNVFWTNETIGPLMVYIADKAEEGIDTLEAARMWKNENPDIWSAWVPQM